MIPTETISDNHQIIALQTKLDFEKAKFKELAGKVSEYIKTQGEWKKYKRSDLFYKKCNLEQEIMELINPQAAKQTVLEWQAR